MLLGEFTFCVSATLITIIFAIILAEISTTIFPVNPQVEFTWGTVSKKRSVSERDSDGSGHKLITTVTKAGPNDPPAPNPPPPKVDEPKDDDTDSDRKMEKAGGD